MTVSPGNFSYSTYNNIAYVAPIVLLGVSMTLMMVFIYALILICWPFKKKVDKFAKEELSTILPSEKGIRIPCWTFIIGGLKLVYGHELRECTHMKRMNIYTICNRHVRPWLLAVLFLVVAFVCTCTTVAFWCAFVIRESNECDTQMDCFALNKSGVVSDHPLNGNCSNYENDNYTIHCFEFSFDYANALGNAGGVLVLASVIMNIQAGLWIGASSQEGKWAWRLAVTGVTILNLLVEAVLIPLPIVVQMVPFLHSRLIDTDRNAVQFYTYWATFLSAFTISGPIFIVFSKRLRHETTIDGFQQYISTTSKNVRMTNSIAGSEDNSGRLDLSDWHDHQKKYGAA